MASFRLLLMLLATVSFEMAAQAANPLGINLAAVAYYSPEQPFLNIVKGGGSSTAVSETIGWTTSTSNVWDTQEESYLPLDKDGYPTSLTASSTLHIGQQFTFVKALLNYNLPKLAPGQTFTYPPGKYRLKFEGQGTVKMAGDAAHGSGDTCPYDLALSNKSANSYVSCTFTVSKPGSNSGLLLEITAIADSADHPRDISVVRDSYAADYDRGAIFNPVFLAALRGFSSLRFMEWMKTNNEFSGYANTGPMPSGATRLTLSGAWPGPTGSYPTIFIDGERREANFTLGSTSVSWSGPLANTITRNGNTWQWGSQIYYSPFFVINKTWATRAQPSNAFWDLKDGVPLEVIVALCNQLQASCNVNVPMMYADSDIASMAQLIMSGTHMQGGYAGLSPALTASFELSNEVWNGSFVQYDIAASLGGATWPTSASSGGNYAWNRSYFGMRSAQMAQALQAALEPALFGRVIPVLGAQAAATYSATSALQASYWAAGPASKYPLKAVAIAPYWGSKPTAGDCAVMTGQKDGGLADFFATLTAQTGASGYTYSSVPAGGHLGQAKAWMKGYTGMMKSTYPTLQLIAYEGGQSFLASSSETCAGWTALVTAAERDARMATAYTDYLTYWQANVGSTGANVDNLFNDIYPVSQFGTWGLLESVMQTVDPLSVAPPKYRAVMDYIRH